MATTNIDPTDAAIAKVESGGNYSAANPQSSARGKYQFMPDTFAGVQRNNPDLPKITFEEFQNNPDAQEQYQKALRLENETTLKRNGLPQTPANAYFTHQFGAPTGVAMLQADPDMGIDQFLSLDTIRKNGLDPAMTVGDLRSFTNQKMDEAMGVEPQPFRVQISGVGDAPGFTGQGLQTAKNPFESIGKEHEKTISELDKSIASIRKFKEGSPEFNIAVADGLKKDMGPNWSKAFIAALFGKKDEAYTQITGGAITPAQLGEAFYNGQFIRVMINSNARGDRWITDATTGQRLPDGTQVTSGSPESAIQTTRLAQQARAGLDPTLNIANRSIGQIRAYEDAQNVVNSFTAQLPTNVGLLEQIQTRTKQFAPALDNITKSAEGRTLLDTIKAFTGGLVDRKALESAAINFNIPREQLGDFITYVRDIGVITKRDSAMAGLHAPGSGTAGDVTFEGGSKNVFNWLNSRIQDHAMQSAYNLFFEKEKASSTSPSELNRAFARSAEFEAVKNMQKYKQDGRAVKLKDGAPIANFDKNGELIIQKWNSNTKRGE
jgi:hypothetical protein